ncbi:MAG TPA: DUF4402 domain-containing protein [Sphingomicrobium sp.]|nr:DUF4402 domain-containing protein [Sphingomicrobium sp.]
MKKLLVSAGALAALAVTATPAHAVPASTDATATVRVLRALQLAAEEDLDLQTIVLSGPAGFSATVGVNQAGVADCDGGSGDVTCSGTMTPATYRVIGANNQMVSINVASTLALDNTSDPAAPDLILDVDAPDEIDLGDDGASTGVTFNIGGSVDVTDTTADGVYVGEFAVEADYQ